MSRPKAGYKLKNGKKAVGVTTVLGRFKESGGLIYWAYSQGQAQERGEINGLYEKRDAAAEAGTLAHDMVENHILGKDPYEVFTGNTYSEQVTDEAIKAYGAYRLWEKQSKLEIFETEIPLVSNKYGYGGCIDAVGKFDGKLILLDWKTGSGTYPDHLYQLAAYMQLWNENFPDNPITGGFHLCRFDKVHGDFGHKYFANLDEELKYFLALLPLYEMDKKTKKRVK